MLNKELDKFVKCGKTYTEISRLGPNVSVVSTDDGVSDGLGGQELIVDV